MEHNSKYGECQHMIHAKGFQGKTVKGTHHRLPTLHKLGE